MNIKVMKIAYFFFILSLLSVTILYAQEIKVVTEDWAPYNYEQKGKITGVGTEIVRATLEKAGIAAEINIYPWSRAYWIALKEKNVLIYTIVRNKERENLFKWIGPIAPRNLCLFKLKKRSDIVVNTIDDVRHLNIGVIRDDVTHQFFQSKHFDKIHAVGNRENKLKMLLMEHVDLISGNKYALAFKMKLMGVPFSEVEEAITVTEEGGYYMAFSKATEDDLVERVKSAFDGLRKEGQIQSILDDFSM